MALDIQTHAEGKIVMVGVTGKLARTDYELFVPEVERLITRHGKIRVLFELDDFHGWDAGALWEDIKFDVRHFNDIERLAVVGEKKWNEWMTRFCKLFTTAKIKYFERGEEERARGWIFEGVPAERAQR